MSRILIRVPNWLGDAVMCTPALEVIFEEYKNDEIILVGSSASVGLFERDERVFKLIIDESKKSFLRVYGLYLLGKRVGKIDIGITFQNSLLSALLLFFCKAAIRVGFKKEARSFLLTHSFVYPKNIHQVERYIALVNSFFKTEHKPIKPTLIGFPKSSDKKRIAISAGAKYGSAKRWEPKRFAEVVLMLDIECEVLLLGGSEDAKINDEIENYLKESKKIDIINLSGKTTISELIDYVAGVSLLICNDSGIMHIASAFEVPTVAIFGPTDEKETSPYCNKNAKIVRLEMPCAPCKKRVCPLKHNNCLKELDSALVRDGAKALLQLT